MATAHPPVIKDGQIVEDENGLIIRERWRVTGLDPNSPSPLFDALQADGLPQYGQPSSFARGLYVRSRTPTPFLTNPTEAYVDIAWGVLPGGAVGNPPMMSFRAMVRSVETSRKVDGSLIRVDYSVEQPADPTAHEDAETGYIKSPLPTQIGRVVDDVPLGILEFDWVANAPPMSLLSFFGTVCKSPWRGGDAYTWQFLDLGFSEIKYRSEWNVHTAFLYNPDTFIKTAFYRLADGVIPEDIDDVDIAKDSGNGWTNRKPRESDFNLISGLPGGF